MKVPIKTKIMTIVHGKSELSLCCSIKSNLRIKHEIYTEKNGRKSIQITSLKNILNNSYFKSFKDFTRKYSDVETKKNKLVNFKLFIIMDMDDCSKKASDSFKDKSMFKEHWLYDYIIPIYSMPNLEETMKQSGIEIKNKKEYFEIFPTNHGDLDINMAKDFLESLKGCNCSNLSKYIEYCLSLVDEIK